jgi:hypothetical protein
MIALILQFHEGDKATAMRLARMIADSEELPRDDVQFYFVARYDTIPDEDTVRYVRVKFPYTETLTTRTKAAGWPAGPNAMVVDILDWFAVRTELKGVLLLEPDCVPLNKHWINILLSEWEGALEAGRVMMGAWRNSGPPGGHINGNCMIIPGLAAWLRNRGFETAQMVNGIAWDCAISPWVKEFWETTGLILNRFQSKDATEEALLMPDSGDESPVFVHGYKDDSAYNIGKKFLKLE